MPAVSRSTTQSPLRNRARESLDESYVYCQSLAKQTARNFYYSFLTLPSDRFRAMCVLYSYMRLCDDMGDNCGKSVTQRAEELAAWRTSVVRALDGDSFDHSVLPALRDIVEKYDIPREHLLATIDGVVMDLGTVAFATFDELSKYCYHVAGSVGLCCIQIWGYRDDRARQAAVDCGLALQLTNILRDLKEDTAMGRIYLPAEDLQRFSYTVEDVAAECRDDRFVRLMQFEVARARDYYDRASQLFDFINPVGKPILETILRTYGGLLNEIERRNYDVFSSRVRLSTSRKLTIAAVAVCRHQWQQLTQRG